jgi:hypothetical protein
MRHVNLGRNWTASGIEPHRLNGRPSSAVNRIDPVRILGQFNLFDCKVIKLPIEFRHALICLAIRYCNSLFDYVSNLPERMTYARSLQFQILQSFNFEIFQSYILQTSNRWRNSSKFINFPKATLPSWQLINSTSTEKTET